MAKAVKIQIKLFFFPLTEYLKDETEEEIWVLVPHVVLMWLLMCLLIRCLLIPKEGLGVINTVKIALFYIFCRIKAFLGLIFLPALTDSVPPHPRQLEYPVTDVFSYLWNVGSVVTGRLPFLASLMKSQRLKVTSSPKGLTP